MIIVDAHQDIAYCAWALQRDFLLGAHEKRARESNGGQPPQEDICTLGLPDAQQGGVALVIGSIFVEPDRSSGARPCYTYATPQQAAAQALSQVRYYYSLTDNGSIRLITSRSDIAALQSDHAAGLYPYLGLMIDLEGSEAITSPDQVGFWYEQGVRQVGPAWAYANRYCGGNREPGPLTADGRVLLRELEQTSIILDISHLAEESFWQSLDLFRGPVAASHANARAIVPGERQLSDDMIRAVAERDGMIGIVLYNRFLQAGRQPDHGKNAVTLADVVNHIDHICNLLGDAAHVGIGSDLDGGFGSEAAPAEIETVADLPRLAGALTAAGYPLPAVEGVMGQNWLRFLGRSLPA